MFWVKGNDSPQIYVHGTSQNRKGQLLVSCPHVTNRVMSSPRTQFVSLCCIVLWSKFPVLWASGKLSFPSFQLCCYCFAFTLWIQWTLKGSNYIMEKRTWSSENPKNILFSSARCSGLLGFGYHFPKILRRLIIPVISNGRDSIFSSLLSYNCNIYSYMAFYILQNAILHMIIITNNPVWKTEQRR